MKFNEIHNALAPDCRNTVLARILFRFDLVSSEIIEPTYDFLRALRDWSNLLFLSLPLLDSFWNQVICRRHRHVRKTVFAATLKSQH